jgi:hypothetical protein
MSNAYATMSVYRVATEAKIWEGLFVDAALPPWNNTGASEHRKRFGSGLYLVWMETMFPMEEGDLFFGLNFRG